MMFLFERYESLIYILLSEIYFRVIIPRPQAHLFPREKAVRSSALETRSN